MAQEPKNTPSSPPIRLIVRNGAKERFETLKEKTRNLQVVVEWDRRQADRRQAPQDEVTNRRQGDRRRRLSGAWSEVDFVVVTNPKSDK